ncbi:DUF397 domain-containing protein [Streptomyces sp. XD-27]|uniref:DUF397 domain-containing protein n=1 Tax=Streptomyces sp. XD-27 TaxID=3062779 RepID=UPI0026F47B1E|nr:DUF397 domain-containing protein [Streptomyces sp. XD-27]WKX70923.1 DUF397 domain-containing protein [Streptomyces sp. XD-27]
MKNTEIHWKKSSFSSGGDGGQCIELAATADGILMRESDEPATVVTTSRDEFRALVLGVKAGEFDHLT